MPTNPLLGNHGLSDVAEQQMRMWALQMETQRRRAEQAAATSPEQLIHPCVSISRETGVDAAEIANLVASERHWKVLDRGILDYMAEEYHWSRRSLEYVDERTASWFQEVFGKWIDAQLVSQAEFVSKLGKIVLMAAQHETTVFVGRGARLFLPRSVCLAVRIIAPKKMRIQRITERRQCNPREAEKFIDDTDEGRANFVKRYFHCDVADSKLYDLVINLEFTSRDAAAKLILSDYKLRFGPA
jgi:cytidylate kinase-like protein